jgi:hypothetical protein
VDEEAVEKDAIDLEPDWEQELKQYPNFCSKCQQYFSRNLLFVVQNLAAACCSC